MTQRVTLHDGVLDYRCDPRADVPNDLKPTLA